MRFQSTLPRGERPEPETEAIRGFMISIHAPARGATQFVPLSLKKVEFQSTLPRGERRFMADNIDSLQIISIHAPARGATKQVLVTHMFYIFQSTLPRGERHIRLTAGTFMGLFQSTLPRGERPAISIFSPNIYDFNPRSREGSDALITTSV